MKHCNIVACSTYIFKYFSVPVGTMFKNSVKTLLLLLLAHHGLLSKGLSDTIYYSDKSKIKIIHIYKDSLHKKTKSLFTATITKEN